MKTVIAFILIIVGISAGPHQFLENLSKPSSQNERIIEGPIENAIQGLAQQIRDAGLDPLYIQEESLDYALPVPVLLNLDAVLEDLLFTGLSDIQINHLNFGLISTTLTYDIELPQIALTAKNAALRVEFFGTEYITKGSGTFAIKSIRVNGTVRVGIGLISGITIRDVIVNLRIGSFESDMNAVIANIDITGYLNNLLGVTIPAVIEEFSTEINELLGIIVEEVISGIL